MSQELQSDVVHLEQLGHWDKADKQVELSPLLLPLTTGLLCFGAILPKHTFKVQYSLLVVLAHLQKSQTPNTTQDATHEICDKTSQHHHLVDVLDVPRSRG